MESLSFRTPEQQPPGKGAFDARPQAVKRWVQELPLGNTGEAARQIYSAIREVNRLAVPLDNRLGMMEALAIPLDSILAALERHYIGSHFPLPRKASRVAEFSHQLLTEVVIAYQEVLNDVESGAWLVKVTHPNLWSLCVHRLLHYMGRILYSFRMIHRPYPSGAWLTLHRLFYQADKRGRLGAKQAMPWAEGETMTIADSYKRAILMDLLEPKLFSLPQLEEIHRNMRHFLPGAKLVEPQTRREDMECFCIRLDMDVPHTVRYAQCESDGTRKVAGLLLDISELGVLLDDALIADRHADTLTLLGSRARLTRETAELLRQCWQVHQGERAERIAADTKVQAAIGMSALFDLMREQRKELHDGITDQSMSDQLEPLETVAKKRRPRKSLVMRTPADIWDSIFYAADLQQNSWAMDGDEKPYRFVQARELNYNESGVCLEFRSDELDTLDVGELIGYCEQGGATVQLFTVRWLEEREDAVRAGLMRLAREVEPLLVLMELEKRDTPLHCLLGIGEDGRPQLFTPHLHAIHEHPLQIVVDGREIPIMLHDKVGLSPLFEAWHFSANEALQVASLDEEMDLAQTNTLLHAIAHSDEEPPEKGDFSDLWDSL
jgi:hypothetical protein